MPVVPPGSHTPNVPSFDDLLAEGSAVPVAGWDFSWFDGRASEERPPWGYARHERIAAEGPFAATSVRFLIEARKPA